jgi:hypothetical protein
MITLAPTPGPAAEAGPASLQGFLNEVRRTNPFLANRVNGPSATDVDVAAIHQAQFERLTALAGEARDQGRGIGAVLWGEAGIGKSHVLSRLARWAEPDDRACFVYLHNLQASPENLPRSLLKAVISILTRGRSSDLRRTPLFGLIDAAIQESLGHDTSVKHSWPETASAFVRLIRSLGAAEPSRAALVSWQVYKVLFRLYRAACWTGDCRDDRLVSRAVRWLAGDYLDPDDARLVGLSPGRGRDEPVALADNQEIKQVLVALTQLAVYRRQPFLLCLDQVDNLDDNQVAGLSRFLEALIDSSPNLLVVTSGVQATLVGYRPKGVIQASAWDRLAQFEIGLQRVSVPEARAIVVERVRRFREPFGAVEAVRQRAQLDSLFPLGEGWAGAFFQDKIDLRPRDVLNAAREGWRREQEAIETQGGPAWLAEWGGQRPTPAKGPSLPKPSAEQLQDAIDRKVEEKVREHQAQRLAEPQSLPPDADNLSGLVKQLLEQCRRAGQAYGVVQVDSFPHPRKGSPAALDLLVHRRPDPGEREASAGLLFLANPSTTSTTAYFRRLSEDSRRVDQVLLVTDQRQPLQIGSRGQQYLDGLRARCRVQHIELSLSDYARLDGLQAVLGLARSGDLEVEEAPGVSRPVTEAEVIASHLRRGRYLTAAVLRDLLTEEPAPPAGAARSAHEPPAPLPR